MQFSPNSRPAQGAWAWVFALGLALSACGGRVSAAKRNGGSSGVSSGSDAGTGGGPVGDVEMSAPPPGEGGAADQAVVTVFDASTVAPDGETSTPVDPGADDGGALDAVQGSSLMDEGSACVTSSAEGDAGAALEWAQWPMPNSPGDVANGAPNPESYTDHGNGTVTDNVTGLMWQQVAPTTLYDWAGAKSYCTALALAGHSDWRLPKFIELVSILDYSPISPLIDTTAFPAAPDTNFWSATPSAGAAGAAREGPGYAWFVLFGNAGTKPWDESIPLNVRCVRSPIPCESVSTARYTTANGTVYDSKTRLTWQQNVPAPTASVDPQATPGGYCASLTLNGVGDWRLPTVKELFTLVDVLQYGAPSTPTIDLGAFPGAPAEIFVSATPLTGSRYTTWYVDFYDGHSDINGGDGDVRCVH